MMKNKTKAVGLLSGGLDSSLAAALMRHLGVKVYGMFFSLPWRCGKLRNAQTVAEKLGITLKVEACREDYIDMVRHARYGYGAGLNPCIDCHLFMIKKAAAYMREIGADFVFTGEILGQRPLSQLKQSLRIIDEQCGLSGRLLRPLSAKLLDATAVETEGLVDREKLLGLSGRSRKDQYKLAEELGLKGYAAPAGGCLLTEPNFGKRLKDLFDHGYRAWNDLVILEWGRHFRLDPQFKAIVGRDEKENTQLIAHAHPEDYILEMKVEPGPTVVLQSREAGAIVNEKILSRAAGLLKHFSRYRDQESATVIGWRTPGPKEIREINVTSLSDSDVAGMWIQ